MTFSNLQRKETLETLGTEQFDLAIIGGGITGAGIALDAASRGMKVALIDMQDFAAGTSSRSTKLVHGGLRYLKQFEVKLVAEVGKERAIVYENGPHVTTPERMLLPIHKGGTFGKFSTNIGLRVYDFLAGVKKAERRIMLSPKETLEKEPLIKKEGLKGGGYYVEYRTDDARLTIEVLKKAVEHGATAINYVKADRFLYDHNEKIVGLEATDLQSSHTFSIKATKVINAAGPWVDEVRKKDLTMNNKQLRLTKGVHVVIDQLKFPLKQAVYFDTPDGRMVFAIPRNGKAYVGTTDTFFDGDTANPKMTTEDRDYILKSIKFMFPNIDITAQDIESSWAGVRPLIFEKGKDPSEISRKDEIWEGESGLITMAGGKLTGYRKMAETVVDLVGKRLKEEQEISFPSSKTKTLKISGGEVGGSHNLEGFIEQKSEEGIQYGFTKEEGKVLARQYGSNVDALFKIAHDYKNSQKQSAIPAMLYAQLIYSIHEEMVSTPLDFLVRRTGALFFDIDWVLKWKEEVVNSMSEILNWSKDEKLRYLTELEKEIKDAYIPREV
ncbi:glycerol-3-phosphate dehydrogenase [Bacillus pakistanensis]|uniref:Glycerol-3-phosphate dehydrogenase n=1 Tax=Rossellomorea pakistanensis TaxID=992288 RepID=A0ABS2NGH0_9BACI|nr:glycerol-3-phosphate dehydrogenase/oxidase [Bacillus pakistanensis]MBM7586957.1 glycerol-3-phosphate dehydrogenase [Bacillus pakistanensis]